jgi:hypothetical protein
MLTEGGTELSSAVCTTEFSDAPSDNQAFFAFLRHRRSVRDYEFALSGLATRRENDERATESQTQSGSA